MSATEDLPDFEEVKRDLDLGDDLLKLLGDFDVPVAVGQLLRDLGVKAVAQFSQFATSHEELGKEIIQKIDVGDAKDRTHTRISTRFAWENARESTKKMRKNKDDFDITIDSAKKKELV